MKLFVLYSIAALFLTALLPAKCTSGNEKSPSENGLSEEDRRKQFSQLRIYQVMVESFQDGDPERNYGVGYGPSNHRGDLKGITAALPYIKSLGMNAIWLTPVFDSGKGSGKDPRLEATGYFIHDYFKIDPNFGTLDDAREMVEAAHELGMYVFFDGVFGHHKGMVKPSPTGKLPKGEGKNAHYPESLDFYKEVAAYWIDELEIDGWRLDQAQQVPVQYWKEIRKTTEEKCRERKLAGKQWGILGYMVGEVWMAEWDIAKLAYGTADTVGLYSAFDFPMRYRLVQVMAVEESGKGKQPAKLLAEGFQTHSQYPEHAIPNLMLTNHDLVRFGDLLQRGGIAQPSDDPYWKRHQAAFSFMTAYSGPITIYYGDEIGAEVPGFAAQVQDSCWIKDLCDDHVSRSTGKIRGLNERETSLKAYLTSLMKLREAHPALWKGTRRNIIANNSQYADLKTWQQEQILYVLNTSENPDTMSISLEDLPAKSLVNLLEPAEIRPDAGAFKIVVNGLSGQFYLVK